MSKQLNVLAAVIVAAGLLNVTAAQAATDLVISQIYGGGGATGASATAYNYDFIQLFNRSDADISLSSYSLQYASATGNFTSTNAGQITSLNGGVIKAHSYFLVQESTASKAFVNTLPTADVIGTMNLSGTAGKVALVSGSLLSGVSSPAVDSFVDLIGYGTANNTTGFKVAALSNTTAVIRDGGGTLDTFTITAPTIAAVPEPSSYALMLGGLGLLAVMIRRRV